MMWVSMRHECTPNEIESEMFMKRGYGVYNVLVVAVAAAAFVSLLLLLSAPCSVDEIVCVFYFLLSLFFFLYRVLL